VKTVPEPMGGWGKGSGTAEVGFHSSFSPHSPFSALKRARYQFAARWAEEVVLFLHTTRLQLGPPAPVASALTAQPQRLSPSAVKN